MNSYSQTQNYTQLESSTCFTNTSIFKSPQICSYSFIRNMYIDMYCKRTRTNCFSLERGNGASHSVHQACMYHHQHGEHAHCPHRRVSPPDTRLPLRPHKVRMRPLSPHLVLRSQKPPEGADICSDGPLAFQVLIHPSARGIRGIRVRRYPSEPWADCRAMLGVYHLLGVFVCRIQCSTCRLQGHAGQQCYQRIPR